MTKCLNAQETEVQIFTDRSRNSAEGGLRSPVVANIQPTQTETLAANMQLVQKTLAGQGPVYKPSSRTYKVIDGGPSTGSPRADESFGDDLVESTDLFSVESLQARRRDKEFIVLLGYAGGILVSVMADTGASTRYISTKAAVAAGWKPKENSRCCVKIADGRQLPIHGTFRCRLQLESIGVRVDFTEVAEYTVLA